VLLSPPLPRPHALRTLASLALSFAALTPALANNSPESRQRRVSDDILPKLAHACGTPLAMTYDAASLRAHNKDIAYDQTDGANECEEPLRYLWAACQTAAGKAAVKAAGIAKVVCKGVPGATGSLALANGTLTVTRAFEEPKPYLRSRKQFESLLHLTLTLASDDPYPDEGWRALASQPNPVTSTTTYCLVNGGKVAFDENVYDPFFRRKQDAKVKCWKDGEIVIDLDLRQGRKTGFATRFDGPGYARWRVTYRDDKRHGEEKRVVNGKTASLTWYEAGERVWTKELDANGRLKSYSRKFADGFGELSVKEDGKVYRLSCSPAAKDDQELRRPCGLDGAVTTSIYDGTGKVARVDTWKDGVIQKQGAGTSDYGSRSEVAFKDGKKHGEERVLAKDGKVGRLTAIVTWNLGVKDGKEVEFADDGKRIVKETIWQAGVVKEVTELYLNGTPKLKEIHESPKRKLVKEFWDTGKVSHEGAMVACDGRSWRPWCEDGVHRSYFESGTRRSEVSYRMGKRHGPSLGWWENGRPETVAAYADDKMTEAKAWDRDGKLVVDDQYEADGSRKLRR
jgi:antitoxin component YwqK of YwqJK toxin-antitoxin module